MLKFAPHDPHTPCIVFAGGGTGGHLYPALALAHALRDRLPNVRFLFFGTQRPIDRRILEGVDAERIAQTLPPWSSAPWRWPRMLLALRQARRLCRARFAVDPPAAVIGTGGLASMPAVQEAVRAGIPVAVLNPDALPGRANRHLGARADVVFAQWPETAAHFTPATTVEVTGCPIRPGFRDATRAAGLERFELDPHRRTLLVTGASQGARTINLAVLANRMFFQSLEGWQILHLTGSADFAEVKDAYRPSRMPARVVAFTDHMADALAAADLVLCRGGASTLAEITAIGRPSVIMPYPHHKDMHQLANARCLVRALAAQLIPDQIDPLVNGPALMAMLKSLTQNDALRVTMATAAQRIGRPDAASFIADRVIGLAETRGTLHRFESLEVSC